MTRVLVRHGSCSLARHAVGFSSGRRRPEPRPTPARDRTPPRLINPRRTAQRAAGNRPATHRLGGGAAKRLHHLERRLDLKLNYTHLPWRANDQKFFVADNSKAQRLIHWLPRTTREQGIEDTMAWEQSQQL